MTKQDHWMHLHARPLDLARWEYFLGNGSKTAVLQALAFYQNEDGGFGHALEPDNWNPNSSPIQTWKATTILREIDCFDPDLPLIKKMLDYLFRERPDGTWKTLIPSNNLHPHAVWWHYENEENATWGYNPTAALLGYLYRLGGDDGGAIDNALDYFLLEAEPNMHELPLFIDLYQDLRTGGWSSDDLERLKGKIQKDLARILVGDPARWSEYVLRPSTVFTVGNREFQAPFAEAIKAEKEFIHDTCQEDGTWDITWNWSQYPQEYLIAREWWKADLIIKYSRFLLL
ncbi:MAG: hypothetical protein WA110_00850 [Anaerolineaceae bacterium]